MGFHLQASLRCRHQHQRAVQYLHSLLHSGQSVTWSEWPLHMSVIYNLNDQFKTITAHREPKVSGLGMLNSVGHSLLSQSEEGRSLARRRCYTAWGNIQMHLKTRNAACDLPDQSCPILSFTSQVIDTFPNIGKEKSVEDSCPLNRDLYRWTREVGSQLQFHTQHRQVMS
ncbi:hypothetical protein ASF71_19965 [Deinococcus sp. Leaf326]|nr:hypothetical protein ASF71_19965 [Deinococcus sp. Leaf326]